jgi:hypothetical protein
MNQLIKIRDGWWVCLDKIIEVKMIVKVTPTPNKICSFDSFDRYRVLWMDGTVTRYEELSVEDGMQLEKALNTFWGTDYGIKALGE